MTQEEFETIPESQIKAVFDPNIIYRSILDDNDVRWMVFRDTDGVVRRMRLWG